MIMDKRMFKKTGENLQRYFMFKKRGFARLGKKGKGTYKRKEKYDMAVSSKGQDC